MKKFLLTVRDERLTAEKLWKWAQEAKESVSLKLMAGSFDSEMDAHIITVVGVIANSEIEEVLE